MKSSGEPEPRERRQEPKQSRLGSSRGTVRFLVAWLFLDAMLNVRYPGPEPVLWYLIPSVDVVLLFLVFAALAWLGWRVPRGLRAVLALWILFVRLLRIGDGVEQRLYGQRFNLYTDLPLVPELVRFGYSTLAAWQFVLVLAAVVAVVALLAAASYRALGCIERSLVERRHLILAAVVCVAVPLGTLWADPPPHREDLFTAGFASSAWSRIGREAKFLLHIYDERALGTRAIEHARKRLRHTATDLARLDGANVHLFVVESYGRAVLRYPPHVVATRRMYDTFEKSLRARGFEIASTIVASTTYGGRSWLAHATLGTGIPTHGMFRYELILAKKPRSLASVFGAAGYRTVLVNPGTTRPWPKGEFYRFDEKYYLWNFDYTGPAYAWAPMPDQYVLDFVRRRELKNPTEPLFIQYVLVSSHAPWNDQPPFIDDWSRIGDGSVYNDLRHIKYPMTWPKLGQEAPRAYIRSILYDLEVLRQFIRDAIVDDSLVVILGDHQPIAEANGFDPSYAVPVHVLSRNPALVARFMEKGYTRGMRPPNLEPDGGLDDFPFELLDACSDGKTARMEH